MGETFYSVLGVDQDADTQTIKQAYRERVKDHHPDVSDAEDAEQIFKRLTDARDVLVDASSRKQYDRVGHSEYVHRYLDSNAWTASGASSSSRSTGGGSSGGSSGPGTGANGNRSSGSRRGGSRGSGRSSNRRSSREGGAGNSSGTAEDYQRYKSGYSPEGENWDGGSSGQQSESSGRAWTEDDFDTSTSSANASTTTNKRDPRRRAQKDQWQTAHAAANAYSPSGRDPGASPVQQTGLANVADAARQVGPWLAFHFVFLVSAFVTVWLFVSWTPSLPTMLASVLLLGFAIFFSILHMISRVYS